MVDVVEKDRADSIRFLEPPTGSVAIPQPLIEAWQDLSVRQRQLFETGQPSAENGEKGYLDYADPESSRLVEKVVEAARGHRQQLIRVLAEDANGQLVVRQNLVHLEHLSASKDIQLRSFP